MKLGHVSKVWVMKMSEFDKPIKKRNNRHQEDSKRVQAIKDQLDHLDSKELLLLSTDNDFYEYCGYYVLEALRSYGNSIISKEIVEKSGVAKTEKVIEELIGFPVKISEIENCGSGDRGAYMVETNFRQSIKELPAPKYINSRRTFDGLYMVTIDVQKAKKEKRNYYEESKHISLRDDFE